ncbi:hypothetical protein DFH28DRAFT_1048264 [Melampsora americana]|nr:hypothetical protein DFH28DRAFT_1048264 [Melampsora americana]
MCQRKSCIHLISFLYLLLLLISSFFLRFSHGTLHSNLSKRFTLQPSPSQDSITNTSIKNPSSSLPSITNHSSINPPSSNLSLEIPPPPPQRPPISSLKIAPNALPASTSDVSVPVTDKSCEKLPLTVKNWKELQIDRYLKSYPNGDKLNLQQFADQHGAYNFKCGLGESCNAGQLCAPIKGPAWWVLFAAQEYNNFQQALYDAIGFVSSEVQSVGSQLVTDLYPQTHKKKAFKSFKIGMALTILSAMSFAFACTVFMFVPGLQPLAIASAMAAASAASATAAVLESQKQDKEAAKDDPFTKWAHYAQEVSSWQTNTQNYIGDRLTQHINSGVSTDKGIYDAIKQGAFAVNAQVKTMAELETSYREVIVARMVNEILKAKEAFITIGSDPCNQGGPGGAFKAEDGWLSYCDPSGTMMNIISAHNDEADNTWPQASSFATKYNVTVEYLTKQAVACQSKYGFLHDPYASGAFPNDKNSECLVNMLVCDCRAPGMHKARKKSNTVHACRHHLGIPV